MAVCRAEQRDGIDADVLEAYDRSVASLARLGAEIVHLSLPARFADLGGTVGQIISAESYAMLADLVDDNATPLDQDVRPRVRAGAAISSKDYLSILAERERMKRAFNVAIEGVDALLTPTAVTPAVPVASIDQSTTPAAIDPLGQLSRHVRRGGAERFYRERTACLVADRLPRL